MSSQTTKLTTCRICEAHCGLEVEVEDNRVLKILPDKSDPYSWRDFCIKAGTADRTLYHPNRITAPMKRVGDKYVETSWDEAIEAIALSLNEIRAKFGNDAIGTYGGNPSAFNTANSIFSAMFFNALGTRSRYFVTSIDNSANMLALQEMIGIPWMNPIPDVDHCDYFLLLGLNPAISALNWGYNVPDGWKRILRAKKEHGATIVLVDPRKTESAANASQHISVKPGSDWALLLGIIKVVIEKGLYAESPTVPLKGFADIASLAKGADLGRLSILCSVPESLITSIAVAFANAKTAFCIGHTGLSMQRTGTINMWLTHVLNAITDRLDNVGGRYANCGISDWTSLLSIPGDDPPPSRVRGAKTIAGFYPLAILPEEITTPGEGQLKALFINAGNPVVSGPESDTLDEALQQLDLLVAIDLVQRESHRHADWLIPAIHMLEREDYSPLKPGLTSEHFVSIDRKVVEPPEGMWAEWEFFLELGLKMGLPLFGRRSLNPLLRASRWLAGTTGIHQLGVNPRWFWRKMTNDGKAVKWQAINREKRRLKFKADKFGALTDMITHPDGYIHLAPESFITEAKQLLETEVDSSAVGPYPFQLISRRSRNGMNSWLWDTMPEKASLGEELEINPDDADRLGINDGDPVELYSDCASATLNARRSDRIAPGVVAALHGMGSNVYDPASGEVAICVGKNIHNRLCSNKNVDVLSNNAVFNDIRVDLRRN